MFNHLIPKIETIIAGRKEKVLSQAGHAVIIKSVISTISNHQMICFRLPKSITTKIDHIQRDFCWGPKEYGKKPLYLRSWNTMTTPKRFEGLGIKQMEIKNDELLARVTWRLLQD